MSDSLWNCVSTYWAQDPKARPVMQIVAQNMIWPRPPEERPTKPSPYRPTPKTPYEVDPGFFDHFLSAGDPDIVDITVEGPPLALPGSQLSNSYSFGIRSNCFTGGYPILPSHPRTHTDTPQSRSRPQFNLQSHQLMGSAVEDALSPVALSIPSSPAHSGHDSHFPVPPWSGVRLLAPPIQTFGPQVQSSRDSDAPSNQSSPNPDWDSAVSLDFEGALSKQQDNSLHPPMLLPPVWDSNYLAPGMMYRNDDTASMFSSDDTSLDDSSPKTHTSNETERPESRLDKDFTEKLQQHGLPQSCPIDFDNNILNSISRTV
ncbi:hypothetical protein MSAN_00329500 [Mycena sanguinolenta]|uniref:Uncharacterized protein n=1 Tax=Mycena sanguinolenta TaxID=230812 RepID=A0A8H7DGD9_9AGAR|nr:hypothetical protein MSAN_00329500 [Mycena sanguinolenta]